VIDRASDTLKHTAFFDVLGGMSEADPEWPATSAGLAVLRLVDGWLTEGSQAAQASVHGLRAVRAAIEAIPHDQLSRPILLGIVGAIEGANMPDIRPLASRLMAYGRCLDHGAKFVLAIDVYQTALGHLPANLEPDAALDAHMRLAHCFRVVGRFDDAAATYAEGKRLAQLANDSAKMLHARVGEGTLAVARGNLPLAQSILDEVIAAATAAGFDEIQAIALHGRAFVANARGQYEDGARFAYDALRYTHSLWGRDRLLIDLSEALTHLGALDAARDGLLVVATDGQEQIARWTAMVDLMEVAAMQMNEPLVERYRRELLNESLPPYLQTAFYYYSGLAYHAFGKFRLAETALDHAGELAQKHGHNQLRFQVDELRDKVRRGVAAERRRATDLDLAGVQDITAAVAEMRALAGV
jgi:tetratricopeptide (TPR) repeat protein